MGAARGFQDLFALAEVDAGSAALYSATAAEVCKRSAQALLRSDASFSPSLRCGGASDSLLDIGCGTGETTRMVADLLPTLTEVVAVDKSRKFLEFAAASSASSGASTNTSGASMHFVELDVETDAFPRNWRRRFTRVFSNYSLHWLKDHRKLMANVADVLTPGGELLLQFFHSTAAGCENEMAVALRAADELGVASTVRQFIGRRRGGSGGVDDEPEWRSADGYSRLLSACGFDVVKCEVVERAVPVESLLERAGTALSVNPLVGLLPVALRAKFAARYAENLRDPFNIVHNVMVVHAFRTSTPCDRTGRAPAVAP